MIAPIQSVQWGRAGLPQIPKPSKANYLLKQLQNVSYKLHDRFQFLQHRMFPFLPPNFIGKTSFPIIALYGYTQTAFFGRYAEAKLR